MNVSSSFYRYYSVIHNVIARRQPMPTTRFLSPLSVFVLRQGFFFPLFPWVYEEWTMCIRWVCLSVCFSICLSMYLLSLYGLFFLRGLPWYRGREKKRRTLLGCTSVTIHTGCWEKKERYRDREKKARKTRTVILCPYDASSISLHGR